MRAGAGDAKGGLGIRHEDTVAVTHAPITSRRDRRCRDRAAEPLRRLHQNRRAQNRNVYCTLVVTRS